MAKLLLGFFCVVALVLLLAQAAPLEEADDLSTAESIGVGYYGVPRYYSPYYGGGYGYRYGGYSGYGYGGYRGYGSYYRRPIYPVWG